MTTCSRTSASPSSSRLKASTRPRAKDTGVDPFIAEIRIFPFNFAPQGWAMCNGQLLPISQNTALFSLLGTQFGGNGTSNFALPNLQGNIPIGFQQGPGLTPYSMGDTGGGQSVTLTSGQLPSHTHTLPVSA